MTNKELVQREDYFHIFIENHLNIYPEERINTLGISVEIEPISAMRLFSISSKIKEAVIEDKIEKWMENIIKDLKIQQID